MKEIIVAIALVLILIQGCGQPQQDSNEFSSSMDTLVITTQKQRGGGLFSIGVSPGNFKDTTEVFHNHIIYPEGLSDLKRCQMLSDFSAEERQYIDIIKGKLGDDHVLIIDENNNNNLDDDPIHIFKPIDWSTENDIIKVKYTRKKNEIAIEDSTWIRIGVLHDDIWMGKSEHQVASFSIDRNKFQIGIASPRSGDFTYDFMPVIALFSQNSVTRDSIGERDILNKGEIIKLNELYYRFDTISHLGGELTLVKINDFKEMTGTQVGMLAPEFSCVTVAGDTLFSDSLNDRTMIIANSCGCGGDKISTDAFYEILEKYDDSIHILRLDSHIDSTLKGNHIDMDHEFNKDIYNKYRMAYCSRTCFVIDRNNRIIDKFPVKKWQQYLPQLMD